MKNKKQRRIMFLLILILGISIGFALLSTTLFINGTAGIKGNTWNIHWDDESVNVTSGSVSADDPEVSTATTSKDTVSFDVEFEMPGDYYEFEIDAVNEGTIDGELDLKQKWITYTIDNASANLPSYMDFSVTYDDDSIPKSGDILSKRVDTNTPGRQKYKIRVEFKSNVEELPSNPPIVNITVELPYVQHAPDPQQNTLTNTDPGTIVYFDPVNNGTCNSLSYNLAELNVGNSTCYKWRIITTDDDSTKENITLQLDHNLVNETAWASDADFGSYASSTKGPLTALSVLNTATSTWTRIPNLNYSYDTSAASSASYGTLNCVDGICKTIKNNTETTIAGSSANPMKARLITGEEIANLAVHNGTPANSNASTWTVASGYNKLFYFSHSSYICGTQTYDSSSEFTNKNLKWLTENTYQNTDAGSETNTYGDYNYGYWTLSPTAGLSYVWYVSNEGDLGYNEARYSAHYGVRPVITVSKSLLTDQ